MSNKSHFRKGLLSVSGETLYRISFWLYIWIVFIAV
ncbi:unnamed protein product [Brassica rapa subsp. trilocularis]